MKRELRKNWPFKVLLTLVLILKTYFIKTRFKLLTHTQKAFFKTAYYREN